MRSFHELEVWQFGMQLTRLIYPLTSKLPKDELFGLSSQIRRATVSIPTNIAEGYGRNNRKEYLQFLGIAAGSQCEVETLLIVCRDVYELDVEEAMSLNKRIGSMLWRLRESLRVASSE